MDIDRDMNGCTTFAEFCAWLRSAPEETMLNARALLRRLEALEVGSPAFEPPEPAQTQSHTSWRVLLWTAPPDVRIGTKELCEALDRPVSWVYRHTSGTGGQPRLPHRKVEGRLVFLVGEIREWHQRQEISRVQQLRLAA
jgi:hypothetical protein